MEDLVLGNSESHNSISSPAHPLAQVFACVKTQKNVAVVFDIDSTLFCVSPRSSAILKSLADSVAFQNEHPEVAKALQGIEIQPSDWGVKTAIQRTQVQIGRPVFEKIRDYWREHFFSNSFLSHDLMYPSANTFVQFLSKHGANIFYLTGRGTGRMRTGTLAQLKYWNFPIADDSRLIMKPDPALSDPTEADEQFKAVVLQEFCKKFEHLWFFENEPVIIDRVRKVNPQVQTVFVNTVHSGRGVEPKDLLTIKGDYQWPFL